MLAIRRVIASLPALTADEIAQRDGAIAGGRCAPHLWPLWPIAQADRALWRRLVDDENIARFSVYGLFPETYGVVYGGANPAVRYDGRSRGRVAIITGQRDGSSVGIVIKPCQSPAEAQIAAIAGELGVGPRQFPSVSGFISEEFVEGRFLTDLIPDDATPDRMGSIGKALGAALRSLHLAGVCYNDATISDPDGRSHVILTSEGSIRLIDFGVALLLRDHPAGLTFHDAYNAARTDPMFRLFRQMAGGGDSQSLGDFVAEYGRRLARRTAEEIQERDWRIAEEGLSAIAARFGPPIVEAIRDGLADGRSSGTLPGPD